LVLFHAAGPYDLGTDWLVFYGAGRAVLNGNIELLFSPEQFTAYLNSTFSWWLSGPLQLHPWIYPPTYLLLVLPFCKLSFVGAYAAFELMSAALLAAALTFGFGSAHLRRVTVVFVLLSPAAALNVLQGQNGFLTAALLVGGWRALRWSPVLGGALLGALTFKPQFWVLVPLALVACREWKAILAAVSMAALLAGTSAALFGIDLWLRWIEFVLHPSADWIANGRIFGISLYAFLLKAGVAERYAEAAQSGAAVLSALSVYAACALPLARDQKLAVILAATLFAAPHSSYYDSILLATAAALWALADVKEGRTLWRWECALFAWAAPFFEMIVKKGFMPWLTAAFIAVMMIDYYRVSRPRAWSLPETPSD